VLEIVVHISVTTIGIGQLRSDTRCYLERAESGEVFEVLRRGRPVAHLRGVDHPHDMHGIAVSPADLRDCAGRLLGRVAAGETVAIQQHGRTVAILEPCAVPVRVKPSRIRAAYRHTAVS
jgi:antitoxin (DNA-binding transcriptional repressor) of toxin-antitoxin stability system